MEKDNWAGCYEDGWNGLIVPEAFSHPAKFSYALTRRMFEHARDKGWIKPRSVVVDPFGGVGTGGIIAAYADIQWIGCELEQKFVDLARENFELHRRKWEGLGCPQPVIIQGDSREMCTVLGAADIVIKKDLLNTTVSDIVKGKTENNYDAETIRSNQTLRFGPELQGSGKTTEQMHSDGTSANPERGVSFATERKRPCESMGQSESGNNISVPHARYEPGTNRGVLRGKTKSYCSHNETLEYSQVIKGQAAGQEPLQLQGREKQCIISEVDKKGEVPEMPNDGESGDSPQEQRPLRRQPEQLGSSVQFLPHEHNQKEVVGCKEGRATDAKEQRPDGMVADLILSSPPYEGSVSQGDGANDSEARKQRKESSGVDINRAENMGGPNSVLNRSQRYGDTEGNIGNDKGPNFWQAARDILIQCHRILRPGGHAIFVTKSFIRNGRRVDFPGDWRRLCESVGFVTVCTHHAMLVKETTDDGLFGEITEKKERKSFFRRLCESRGSPEINWEVVLCMEK